MNTPELPPLPNHPEPRIMEWTKLEMRTIKEYGEACALAAIQAPAIVVQQEPIYQIQLASGNWADQSEESYQYNLKSFPDLVRVVYTNPAQQAKPQPLSDDQIIREGLLTTPLAVLHNIGDMFKAGARFAEAAHGIKE